MQEGFTETNREAELPQADAVLEANAADLSAGFICAALTPLIKSRLREMEPGHCETGRGGSERRPAG